GVWPRPGRLHRVQPSDRLVVSSLGRGRAEEGRPEGSTVRELRQAGREAGCFLPPRATGCLGQARAERVARHVPGEELLAAEVRVRADQHRLDGLAPCGRDEVRGAATY